MCLRKAVGRANANAVLSVFDFDILKKREEHGLKPIQQSNYNI
jgi:hypothetical protein